MPSANTGWLATFKRHKEGRNFDVRSSITSGDGRLGAAARRCRRHRGAGQGRRETERPEDRHSHADRYIKRR